MTRRSPAFRAIRQQLRWLRTLFGGPTTRLKGEIRHG